MSDKQSAYEFIKEHASASDKNDGNNEKKFNISRGDYYDYLKSQGISREIVDKYNEVHSDLVNGADQFNTEQLQEMLNDATKNGKNKLDPKEEDSLFQSVVAINAPSGSIKIANNSRRTSTVPTSFGDASGERKESTKFNTLTVDWKQKQFIDKKGRASYEDTIRDFYNLD